MQRLIEVLATNMGGYGAYIWPSFLITAVFMLGILMVSLHALKRASATLAKLQSSSDEA